MPSSHALASVLVCVAAWSAGAHGAEATAAQAPAVPQAQPVAAPPYTGGAYELDRSETIRARFNGQELWYKGRLSNRTRLGLVLEVPSSEPQVLRLRVPSLTREIAAEGPERILRISSRQLDERSDGRRVRLLDAAGTPVETLGLKQLTEQPWYELSWTGKAWAEPAVLAEGEAWPLADGLGLGREAALVLPPVAGLEEKGRQVRQQLALPYPAPLAPAPLTAITYQVVERSGRTATLAVSGSSLSTPAAGVTWGGIRLKGAQLSTAVAGTVKIALDEPRVLEAKLKLEVSVRKTAPRESFDAQYKLETVWKPAAGR